ncbi:MAG: septum formation protein Maf [Phycisphaeraceae bacterium]|nr:septum formation protein Maf [Phycisphaeraceae bacterium]
MCLSTHDVSHRFSQGQTLMNTVGAPAQPASPARIILASRSARRRSLLDEAGIAHEAHYPGFEDGALAPGAHTSPSQWVCALAYLKAWAKAQETPGATVIGADTVCVLDGQVVGTPTDAWEAEQMLRSFVGREHDVITGVAIISRGADRTHRRIFHERATVRWGMIPDEMIAAYVATGEWQGKAGGYNLRDRTGAGWPITYSGDPHTIMGLPVEALRRHLSTMARPEQDAARV